MNIVVHISFYYSRGRFKYLTEVIREIGSYDYKTDIFVHTNRSFPRNLLGDYTNGKLEIVVHKLSNGPFYLTWAHRDLMRSQRDQYDVFMYIEDDIRVPREAISYWLNYKDGLLERDLNLGFLRIEIDRDGVERTTDNSNSPDGTVSQRLTKIVEIDGKKFVINDQNPYCAFWIYDKKEFNVFVDSKFWNIENIVGYGVRESAAIGMTQKYKYTVIPMDGDQPVAGCKIYHLPNNYIDATWRLNRFDDVIRGTTLSPLTPMPST